MEILKKIIEIVLFFSIIAAPQVKATSTCLSCKESPLPRDCQYTTICGSHEVCYTNSFATSVGSLRHEMGCMDKTQCSRVQTVRSTNNRLICTECCNGTLCNSGLCGQKGIPPLVSGSRGPICYSCDQQLNPNTCHVIKECSRDEICDENLRRFQSGGNSGNVLGKRELRNGRDNEQCALKCCGTDLCNSDCSGPRVVHNVNVTMTLVTKPATPKPTTPSRTTPFSVQTTEVCIDKNTACAGYHDYCNMDWGLLNCRKTCGLCNVALNDPCIDRTLCSQKLQSCNTDWGLQYCIRSCDRCAGVLPNQNKGQLSGGAHCETPDFWPTSDCERYRFYCNDQSTYVKDVCKHYCGHC